MIAQTNDRVGEGSGISKIWTNVATPSQIETGHTVDLDNYPIVVVIDKKDLGDKIYFRVVERNTDRGETDWLLPKEEGAPAQTKSTAPTKNDRTTPAKRDRASQPVVALNKRLGTTERSDRPAPTFPSLNKRLVEEAERERKSALQSVFGKSDRPTEASTELTLGEMNIRQLKAMCKTHRLRKYSYLCKAELIELLQRQLGNARFETASEEVASSSALDITSEKNKTPDVENAPTLAPSAPGIARKKDVSCEPTPIAIVCDRPSAASEPTPQISAIWNEGLTGGTTHDRNNNKSYRFLVVDVADRFIPKALGAAKNPAIISRAPGEQRDAIPMNGATCLPHIAAALASAPRNAQKNAQNTDRVKAKHAVRVSIKAVSPKPATKKPAQAGEVRMSIAAISAPAAERQTQQSAASSGQSPTAERQTNTGAAHKPTAQQPALVKQPATAIDELVDRAATVTVTYGELPCQFFLQREEGKQYIGTVLPDGRVSDNTPAYEQKNNKNNRYNLALRLALRGVAGFEIQGKPPAGCDGTLQSLHFARALFWKKIYQGKKRISPLEWQAIAVEFGLPKSKQTKQAPQLQQQPGIQPSTPARKPQPQPRQQRSQSETATALQPLSFAMEQLQSDNPGLTWKKSGGNCWELFIGESRLGCFWRSDREQWAALPGFCPPFQRRFETYFQAAQALIDLWRDRNADDIGDRTCTFAEWEAAWGKVPLGCIFDSERNMWRSDRSFSTLPEFVRDMSARELAIVTGQVTVN